MEATAAVLVRIVDLLDVRERAAIAGFLAGYTGTTRVSYTTDLRIFLFACTRWRSPKRSEKEFVVRSPTQTLHRLGICYDGPRKWRPGTRTRSVDLEVAVDVSSSCLPAVELFWTPVVATNSTGRGPRASGAGVTDGRSPH
jgi:hypothetical protein